VELEVAEAPPAPFVELAELLLVAALELPPALLAELDPPPLPLEKLKHLPCEGGIAGGSHVGAEAPASAWPMQTPTGEPMNSSVLSHLPGAQSPSSQQYRAHFVAPAYAHVFPGLQSGSFIELGHAPQVSWVPGASEQ
jgi:hypothetical protein